MEILSKHYSEGWKSYEGGNTALERALRKNTHKPWSQEWISWNRGWNEAKDSGGDRVFNLW